MNIGKIYKTPEGDTYRVTAVHSFGGMDYCIAECIDRWNRTSVATTVQFRSATEVDASEWTDALKRVAKANARAAKKAQNERDAEQYGVSVCVVGGARNETLHNVKIIRCTPTRYTDSAGKQYSRENGCRVGDRYSYYTIDREGIELLASIVGERLRVDIVAERKKAQSQP